MIINFYKCCVFIDAFKCLPNLSLDDIKIVMILYENFATFELASGNVHVASEIFRSMVLVEKGFVDGWVMLLTLYFKHSPMDVVVKIAEDALHQCENDVAVVFIYSKWLNEKV